MENGQKGDGVMYILFRPSICCINAREFAGLDHAGAIANIKERIRKIKEAESARKPPYITCFEFIVILQLDFRRSLHEFFLEGRGSSEDPEENLQEAIGLWFKQYEVECSNHWLPRVKQVA